jgi:rhamnose transport system permease protein
VRVRSILLRGETTTLLLVLVSLFAGTRMSANFWQPHLLLFDSSEYLEFGLLALPMTLLIAAGEIDLSVGSSVGLCGSLIGLLFTHHVPLGLDVVASIVCGTALGLVNGLLVTRLRLPSLVVTLATMAIFRGIAQVVVGSQTILFPDWYTGFDQKGFTGTQYDVPVELVGFIVLGILFAFVLHRTVFGRVTLTIGANRDAATFSGLRVDRVRLIAFAVTGAVAGLAAVLYTSRAGSVTYTAGNGYELLAITVVILGGADIFGGRASMVSTILAVFAVVAIREAMSVRGIDGLTQNGVIGALLVVAVLLPSGASVMRSVWQRLETRSS